MLLERIHLVIEQVVFDSESYIKDKVLHISKQDLENVAADEAFSKIEFELACPGEKCRIVNMGDIVQPAIKLGEGESTFPGVVDKLGIVGSGSTLMLDGVVISETVEVKLPLASMMETSEAVAEMTDFAKMIHIVIDAFPGEGVSKESYMDALHKASKRLAKFLASLAMGLEADYTENFTLECDGLDGLPKIAYLANLFCHAPYQETTVYGGGMIDSLPTIIHPNEILDGALTNKNYNNSINADPTFVWQNHPIILDLYSRHGKDLNFVGVVLNNAHHIVETKQRNASMAAALVAKQLKAEGVIITKEGGGHPQVDVGFETDILEGKYGIKTSILFTEFLSPNNDSNGQLLIKTKHADAIVSTGCFTIVEFPPVDKVIGHIPQIAADGKPQSDLSGTLAIKNRTLQGCESQLGWTYYGSQKF
ncbi:MAG: hypothetical protein IKV79_03205 [Oscillospiraceae bacterium]|nr:hypothetical protein [Oscillospiraceae bacterium]